MKLVALLILYFSLNQFTFSQSDSTGFSRIMTFNIRISFANDGENSWDYRKSILLNTIKKNSPDILCVQEATPEAIQAITNNLPEYLTFGRGRDSINSIYNESCHIFYKSAKYVIDSTNSGTFWFSNTPETPGSKSWNTAFTRICTFARLVEKKSNKGIYIYNNHWDHLSAEARDRSSVLLIKKIKEQRFPNENTIITGDFNAEENQWPIEYLTRIKPDNTLRLYDTYRVIHPERIPEVDFTFHGFTGIGNSRIDYIFIPDSKNTEIIEARIDKYNKEGRYPSDHFPLVVDLFFR